MRKWIGWLVLAAVVAVGCGSGEKAESKEGGVAAKKKLEVAAFKGGYGIDFYESVARDFEKKHTDVKVEVWGNPRVWEQLKPRFNAGDPPDLTFPGWGMDHWVLAEEGQLIELDKALDGPAAEGEGTWRDTFEPSILKLGQLDGKQYVLPYYVMLFGWWYDPDVFAKNGWTPPATFEDLLALCPKIKAAGMAPITFQGQYPYYMIDGMLLPWCMSAGGKEAVDAAQNMEPGAWKSPAMLKAAQMIDQLNKAGCFEHGAVAMTHTEAQQDFLNGKAALVPCGTWLYSEMKEQMKPDAKIRFILPPHLSDGKGDPTAMMIGIEPWMVPSEGKNQELAIEFYKFMTTKSNAMRFVKEKATPTAIKGSNDVELSPEMVEPARCFKDSKALYSVQYRAWYPAFNKTIENKLTSMLNGELTPEQFCDTIEAAAEEVRKDPNLNKHKVAE